MTVTRIVANFASADVNGMAAFYSDLLNLNILMDQGWIITLGSGELGPVQLSIASQGGAGAPVPDISVEVEDVDEVYERACAMGVTITYPICDESWGVRRFFVADPMGREINILSHI
jgi:predicted enzyme related to lactoylglutathione lyase